MGDLLRDLRYSVRMLVRNPLFTIAAILTLALGIGLNAATFSAVYGILLRPLGGADHPERLVQIYRQWPAMDYGSVSMPHYRDLRDRTGDVFESVAAYYIRPIAIAEGGRSDRVLGTLVSANFFQTYGAKPLLGRAFLPDEESVGPGAHPVAVLGNGFWRSRFGGDPDIVGRTVHLNGHPFEVVGVMPPEFRGPVVFADIPIYVPLMMQPQIDPGQNLIDARGWNMMTAVGRLRDGQTVERAGQVLDALLAQLREEYPEEYDTQRGHTLVPQNEAGIHPMFKSAQVGMSTVMMAVVALLLLIACVNVANLFLVRARERRREIGIRLSIGAGRGRIIRQLMTESLLFSLLAGVAGLGLAWVAIGFLGQIRPPMDGPWDFAFGLDTAVLLFTLAVSVAAGFLFGLVPALQASNPDTISAVKGEMDGKAGSSRVSSGLVVLQMALSLLLLISSGLFIRSLQGATRIDPGFDEPSSLVMASVDPGLQGYDEARSRAFFDRVLEAVGALPDVTAAGFTDALPLGLGSSDRGVEIPGYEFGEGEKRSLMYADVTEGYLEAMGVRLLEGRTFTRQDDAAGAPVIIIERADRGPVLARRIRRRPDHAHRRHGPRDHWRGRDRQVPESGRGADRVHVHAPARAVPERHDPRRADARRCQRGVEPYPRDRARRRPGNARVRRAHDAGSHGHRAAARAPRRVRARHLRPARPEPGRRRDLRCDGVYRRAAEARARHPRRPRRGQGEGTAPRARRGHEARRDRDGHRPRRRGGRGTARARPALRR